MIAFIILLNRDMVIIYLCHIRRVSLVQSSVTPYVIMWNANVVICNKQKLSGPTQLLICFHFSSQCTRRTPTQFEPTIEGILRYTGSLANKKKEAMACGKKDQLCGGGVHGEADTWASMVIWARERCQQWWRDGNIMVAACDRRRSTTLGTKGGVWEGVVVTRRSRQCQNSAF
jgi:hypothetical protein